VAPTTIHGLLVIDKPAGITSRDAVNRAQGWFPRGTPLGHTGTLDPLATGVLVLCVGKATRLVEYVQRMPKTYSAGVVLGARSDTDDADGTIVATAPLVPPTLAQVRHQLASFVGETLQIPPAYSAAKVTGRRAYAMARRGEEVSLAARSVTIHAIDMMSYAFPLLEVEVRCGKGTYIRALARDLGERLGCGGYIQTLRRTRVGCFDVSAAVSLDADAEAAQRALLPLALAASDLPQRTIADCDVVRLRQGQALPSGAIDPATGEVALLDERGALIAVGMLDRQRNCIRPGKVMAGPKS
jgi:tRNA pseudouridine55 synthase